MKVGDAPEIEMTKMKAGDYGALNQNEFAETPYKMNDWQEFEEADLKQELGGETVDGTFVMSAGMAGEEYFETNPNDTSYEIGIDGTNRDLITDDVPVDMRSPDVTQILDGA